MNKLLLRQLFDGVKSDVRDYYDAQRDMVEAQRHIMEKVVDIAAVLSLDNGGVIAQADGVSVAEPPQDVHTFYEGRCLSHASCHAKDPQYAYPTDIMEKDVHTFYEGRCLSHASCHAKDPQYAYPTDIVST